MYKIHLLHKESLIVIALGIASAMMVIINVAVLVPAVIEVYSQGQSPTDQSPIDVATVNQAVEILEAQ